MAYALYGLTAVVLYFAASVRWGSMQFWVLLVGTLPVIAMAMSAEMLSDRILAGSRYFAWLVPMLLLVAGPIGIPVLLLWLANLVAFSF